MPFDRTSAVTLKNLISQIELLISTTTPLPENRTSRCLELLRAAQALTEDATRATAQTNGGGTTQPAMDDAEKRARPELEANWPTWSALQLAEWWERWYLSAGHKRLGRMLLEITGVKPKLPAHELSPEQLKDLGIE